MHLEVVDAPLTLHTNPTPLRFVVWMDSQSDTGVVYVIKYDLSTGAGTRVSFDDVCYGVCVGVVILHHFTPNFQIDSVYITHYIP